MARLRRRGALRHSLLARLLASSVLVAVCSIIATAWLAVQGTSDSISVEQGETLAVDTRIHDTLVGYAAEHPQWDGVQGTVDDLAADTGRRIVLTTENRRPIADSGDGAPALPMSTTSVVDPLAVDVTFAPEDADRIDARAVGPFKLGKADRSRLRTIADDGVACMDETYGETVEVTVTPSGRPFVAAPDSAGDPELSSMCGLDALDRPTKSERKALAELNRLMDACRKRGEPGAEFQIDGATGEEVPVPAPDTDPGAPSASTDPDNAQAPQPQPSSGQDPAEPPPAPEPSSAPRPEPEPEASPPAPEPPEQTAPPEAPEHSAPPEPTSAPYDLPGPEQKLDPRTAACVDSSRREQLDPYVAPAALLFIDDPDTQSATGLSLSRDGLLRVSGVVLAVLVLTVVVSVVVSTRLVRPVHALTDAVQRMRAGEGAARVAVRDSGEIGRLATAFNEMSAHLERMEAQRKAMVSDVSHELRTPLSNLRGWLEAAQDGVAAMDPKRMAMLVEETLVLQRIIDDLQDLALADAGKLRLTPEPVGIAEVVEQAAASYRLRARDAGLRLTTEASDGTAVVADRTRLLQAVGNLLSNALRHTPAPGAITVRAYAADGDAVIEVADTGTGIAPEHLPHVFSRFWREERSRSRRTGGSGLGLAIVRNLVELHGGSASVASTPGEGSTFTLRIPLDGGPLDGRPGDAHDDA
ncbi:two-component system sensor histidine kinase BaeS [Murinocardiopsis flavida]|uniref:histidine kinase n=1 Tax=Murinocardiopsis flavida TaxID=645275 RepID=A0A2P8DRP0_9ACTN|nr:HAMP domain-containing sensor histidine kinase [Murinocardiopsis flavida]PSK99880.1 two-component system sensor histidine kinase BaeS [Murinocardiopsis flavida]